LKNFSPILKIFLISLLFSTQLWADEGDPVGKKYLTIYMGIQHQEVLSHLPPDSEFFGDFRTIVDGELDRERKTIRFTPKAPGLATLTIHDRKGEKLFEYRIEVRKSQLTKVVREVRGLLDDIEGISIKIVNDKVVIDGKVLLPRDLNRIYGVIKQYEGQVSSLVEINPMAQNKIADLIEREINNPDIEVRAVNGKFILNGIANSESDKERAEIIAKTYVPAPVIDEAEAQGIIKKRNEIIVINLITLRAPPPPEPDKIIQIVVHYVELNKNYLRSAAFKWAPTLQDNTDVKFTKDTRNNSDGIVAEISGIITNLLPKLNTAKSHGFARILESTSVTTKDGKPGLVKSITEVTFSVRDPSNVGVSAPVTKEAGLITKITPTIINPRSDVIELIMEFDVSSIIGVTGGNVQIARNTVNTSVNVRSGQSAAVGGLIKNTTGTEYNPDPNQDALFNIYASKDFRRNKTQFVVFVTPIIKSSASAGSEKIKEKFRLRE
jgi:pilus assembly protein CpaC